MMLSVTCPSIDHMSDAVHIRKPVEQDDCLEDALPSIVRARNMWLAGLYGEDPEWLRPSAGSDKPLAAPPASIRASKASVNCGILRTFLTFRGIMESIHSRLERSPLPFLHLMETLKHLPRTGWLRTIKNPESVAAHMYRLSLLAMFAPVRSMLLSQLRSFDVAGWVGYRKVYIPRAMPRHGRISCWRHSNICWSLQGYEILIQIVQHRLKRL